MVTFAVAFLPQFVDRSLGHVPAQFAVLGVIFIALELLIDGAVGLAAGRLAWWLSRRRRARQALDVGSGTVMIALAARLAFER
jgi:threonine/homoserine/homoserine lactone efflux protein